LFHSGTGKTAPVFAEIFDRRELDERLLARDEWLYQELESADPVTNERNVSILYGDTVLPVANCTLRRSKEDSGDNAM
jgi:hypothetical protein